MSQATSKLCMVYLPIFVIGWAQRKVNISDRNGTILDQTPTQRQSRPGFLYTCFWSTNYERTSFINCWFGGLGYVPGVCGYFLDKQIRVQIYTSYKVGAITKMICDPIFNKTPTSSQMPNKNKGTSHDLREENK